MGTMHLEEKKRLTFDYIQNHFTESTLTELTLFDRNSKALMNVIRLEIVLDEKIEGREFLTGMTEEFLSETKQFLCMDALAETQDKAVEQLSNLSGSEHSVLSID
jgi:hypothetical protein